MFSGLERQWYSCYYFARLLDICLTNSGWGYGSCCDTMYWYGLLCQGLTSTLQKYNLVPPDATLTATGCVSTSPPWFYASVTSPCETGFATLHTCAANAMANLGGVVSGCCTQYRSWSATCSHSAINQAIGSIASYVYNLNSGAYVPPGVGNANAYGVAGLMKIISSCPRTNSESLIACSLASLV